MARGKYYVTVPVADAALGPTIESIYRAVLADAIARRRRMTGSQVTFLMGADAHCAYKNTATRLDVGGTHFVDTSSIQHRRAVEALLRRTMRRSWRAIYKGRYEGRFCRYDQMDVTHSTEPVNCPKCGGVTELISEDRYLFRLSAFQGHLLALYRYRPEFIQPPQRLSQLQEMVQKGLPDIPISVPPERGSIPWPDDEKHAVGALYSELVAYLSGIAFSEDGGSDDFRRNWPANLHVTGPSEFESHAVYWPAFLTAAEMPLPRRIFGHPAVDAGPNGFEQSALSDAIDRFGSDAVRYCLLRGVLHAQDSRMDLRAIENQYQADPAGGLEGVCRRVLTLARTYCDGRVPEPSTNPKRDYGIETLVADLRATVRIMLDAHNFSEALGKICSLATLIEKNVAEAEESGDEVQRRLTDIVHDTCQGMAWVALFMNPVLPRTTAAIWKSLGQNTRLEDQLVDEAPWSCLRPGTVLGTLEDYHL